MTHINRHTHTHKTRYTHTHTHTPKQDTLTHTHTLNKMHTHTLQWHTKQDTYTHRHTQQYHCVDIPRSPSMNGPFIFAFTFVFTRVNARVHGHRNLVNEIVHFCVQNSVHFCCFVGASLRSTCKLIAKHQTELGFVGTPSQGGVETTQTRTETRRLSCHEGVTSR